MFLKTKPLTYNFLLQRARTLTMGWSESGGAPLLVVSLPLKKVLLSLGEFINLLIFDDG